MDNGPGSCAAHTLMAWAWVVVLGVAALAGGGCKDQGGGIEKAQKRLRKAIAPLAKASRPRRGWGRITLKIFIVHAADKARWQARTGRKWSPLMLGPRLGQKDDSGREVEVGGERVEVWAMAWDPTGQAEGRGVVILWYKDGRAYCAPQPRVMARYPGIKGVAAWAGVWMEPGLGARLLAGLGLGGLVGGGRCYGRLRAEVRPLRGIKKSSQGPLQPVAGQKLLASRWVELKP